MRYFVDVARRLVRTLHHGDLREFDLRSETLESGWVEVQADAYDAFRSHTAQMGSQRALCQIHRGSKRLIRAVLMEGKWAPVDAYWKVAGPSFKTKKALMSWAKSENCLVIKE